MLCVDAKLEGRYRGRETCACGREHDAGAEQTRSNQGSTWLCHLLGDLGRVNDLLWFSVSISVGRGIVKDADNSLFAGTDIHPEYSGRGFWSVSILNPQAMTAIPSGWVVRNGLFPAILVKKGCRIVIRDCTHSCGEPVSPQETQEAKNICHLAVISHSSR